VSWIRAAASHAVLDAAASRGLPRADVIARARVPELPEDRAATIETVRRFSVIETCVRMLDDPGFVIDIAEHAGLDPPVGPAAARGAAQPRARSANGSASRASSAGCV
jgi:hypothetical protein